jgi:hypothetical protein
MRILILMLALWMPTAHAQHIFDGSSGNAPPIYNTVSTTGSIRAGQIIIPTQPAGVTPTALKGATALTNGGDLCV